MLPAAVHQSLPGLVQRAASQLASASSAAEVLEARDMAGAAYTTAKAAARLAKAKGAHDELIAKAHRAQADALEIEAMAKRRLADEYDAAQERGEAATQGRPAKRSENETFFAGDEAERRAERADEELEALTAPAKISEIPGLSKQEIHEARQIRDAEEAHPGIVRETLDAALDAGEEPTKAAVRRATAKRKPQMSAAGKQLAKLRQAWREACPAVRQQFRSEINQRIAA